MALTVSSLGDIVTADYEAALQTILQMSAESHPDLDIRRGAFRDLVLHVAAQYAAVNAANLSRLRQSSSLLAIADDPTLADEDTLNRLASNYGVVRSVGSRATGSITIVLSSLVSTVISAGQVFTDSSGNQFATETSFTGRTTSGEVVATTDRLISAVGDGTFAFTITAVAVNVGIAGNIARGVVLTVSTSISSKFVRAFAGSAFSGGTDAESNTSLLTRIQTSWTASSLGSRSGVENLIRRVVGYEQAVAVSVVGYGDAEQRRDHSILPLAMPGRVDVWLKSSTSGAYITKVLTKTATYQGPGGVGTLWRFDLLRDDVPGFYEVEKIQTAANIENTAIASYTITLDSRNYDLATGATDGLIFLPDITSATEAAYSRYSTAQITFNDTDVGTSGLTAGVSTRNYSVIVRHLPGISEIQDAVASRSARSTAGDALIRAAVPIFVAVTVNVGAPTGITITAAQQTLIKKTIADLINATGFIGSLSSVTILSGLSGVLPTSSVVTSLSMSGRMRRPDGTSVSLGATTSALTPSTDTTNLVSARTVGFFCSPESITLTTSSL